MAKNVTSDIDPIIYVQYYDKSIDILEIKTDEIIAVIFSLCNSAQVIMGCQPQL